MTDLLTGDIPESPASARKRTGVTHLNKKPLIVMIAAVAILLGVAGFALQKMAARQNKEVQQSKDDYQAITQDAFVDSYLSDRGDGVIAAKEIEKEAPKPPAFLYEPMQDPNVQKVSTNPEPVTTPAPVEPRVRECGSPEECAFLAKVSEQAGEAVLHERMRLQQLRRNQLETAVSAAMRVNFNRSGDPEIGACEADEGCERKRNAEERAAEDPATAAGNLIRARATSNLDNMMALVNSRIEAASASSAGAQGATTGGAGRTGSAVSLKGLAGSSVPAVIGAHSMAQYAGSAGGTSVAGGLGVMNASRQNEFLNRQGQQESDYLEETLQDPRSSTELKAGTVIRAALLTGINSELPGQIIGQVTRNVWDTVSGEYILIPQGARLIGRYDSGISFGQKRLLVAWSRIIYPNGQSIRLNGMQGYDQAGQSGFKDKINNHYGKVFGSALLFSVVAAGVSKVDANTNRDNSVFSSESAFKDEMAKQISKLSNKYLDAALNIAPTLSISQGYVLNVMVDKDIVLPAYEQMHRQFVPRYFPDRSE